jgi:Fe-S-cluster containining protein
MNLDEAMAHYELFKVQKAIVESGFYGFSSEDISKWDILKWDILYGIVRGKLERHWKVVSKIQKYFECDRCGRCCKFNPRLYFNEFTFVHDKHKDKLKFVVDNGIVMLFCEFGSMVDGKWVCSIYDKRFKCCRTYPFFVNGFGFTDKFTCKMARQVAKFVDDNLDGILLKADKYIKVEDIGFSFAVEPRVEFKKASSVMLSLEMEEAMLELLEEKTFDEMMEKR